MSEKISLFHGSGGEGTKYLIDKIVKELDNEILRTLLDSAILDLNETLAFTTDSYVISPPFFKGGDIGKLSIFGTVNDLSVVGAKPLFLSLSFIIEEGFEVLEFERIVKSIKEASKTTDVKVVTGDTKVVEKGKGDKIFINTSGVGIIEKEKDLRNRKVEIGDLILINGGIGEHGLSIMLERLGVKTGEEVKSDLSPLNSLILPLLSEFKGIKFMRDPTRGGVATVLNEISKKFEFEIELWEESLPIKDWVKEASNILGIDPLYAANEGKVVMVVKKEEAEKVLEFLKNHPLGKEASIIGRIKDFGSKVYLKTEIGTKRILDTLKKDLLPRIC